MWKTIMYCDYVRIWEVVVSFTVFSWYFPEETEEISEILNQC
jgi:hypothetical protein